MVGLCTIMNGIETLVLNYLLAHPFAVLLLSVIVGLVFVANLHYAKKLFELFHCNNNLRLNFEYDYGIERGPHKWKERFPAARGYYQSPINIRTDTTQVLRISEPLLWDHYDDLPLKMVIENTGHMVELRAHFQNNHPTLKGADLMESYAFVSLGFRWSRFSNIGSEHALNNNRFAMELQATHISRENPEFNSTAAGDLGILTLSYFYAVTKSDNPYLDPIVLNLYRIREPFKCVEIQPFPISWLCYPFKSGFYSYGGSLTEPPCSEGVTWFVQPEAMAISEKQLDEFRKLISKDGQTRIARNCRPVQNLNSRIVCYNRFDQFSRFSEGATPEEPIIDHLVNEAICS